MNPTRMFLREEAGASGQAQGEHSIKDPAHQLRDGGANYQTANLHH